MNQYYPDNKNDKNEGWFTRTLLKVGVLSGLVFAAHKMKGPAKDIINRIHDSNAKRIIEREDYKRIDSQKRILGPNATLDLPFRSFQPETEIDRVIEKISPARNAYPEGGIGNTLRTNKLNQISTIEDDILSKMKDDITFSNIGEVNDPKAYLSIIKMNKDSMLFEIRKDILENYFLHNPYISEGHGKELQLLNDPDKDGIKLNKLIDLYTREDPDLADMYIRRLTSFKANYNHNIVAYNTTSKLFSITPEITKQLMLYTNIRETNRNIGANLRYIGKINKYKVKTVLSNEELKRKPVTSSSLYSRKFIPITPEFKLLGEFDYTNDIKSLMAALEEIATEDNGFESHSLAIIQDGPKESPRYYLRFSAKHVARGKEKVLNIPLAQYGILPATSPYGVQKYDVKIPDPAPINKKMPYMNMTQATIRNLIRYIKSNLSSDFKYNPEHAFSRFNFIMRDTLEVASRIETTNRDPIKQGMFYYRDERVSNKLKWGNNLKDLQGFKRLARLTDGALVISVDLETISNKKAGPNVQITDAHTQITQAGFSVADISSTGKVTLHDMQKFFSSHGVDKMKELPFDMEQAEWIRDTYLSAQEKNELRGRSPEDIINKWGEKIKSLTKTQGRDFKDNNDIARHLVEKIIRVVEENPDKPIYLTSKFGTYYDFKMLEILESKDPIGFSKLKKYANISHIDVHGIVEINRVVVGGVESLSQTNLLKLMMKEKGLSAHNFETSNNIIEAINTLRGRPQSNLVVSTALLKKLNNDKTLFAHDAGTDSMLLHLLLGHELEKYHKGKKQFDSAYEELEYKYNSYHAFKSFDDQIKDARDIEMTNLFGFIPSSTALSSGQAAKYAFSIFTTRHFLPIPDYPPAKQANQFMMGTSAVVAGLHSKSMNERLDPLVLRKYARKIIPPWISRGELDFMSFGRDADAMTHLFSNTVMVKYFSTISNFGSQEGGHHLTSEIFKDVNLEHTDIGVNLSDVSSRAEDPSFNYQVLKLEGKIKEKLRVIKSKKGSALTKDDYDYAAYEVIQENEGLTKIPKGTKYMASRGDLGKISFNAPVNGRITKLNIWNDSAGSIKMMADIKYVITDKDRVSMVGKGLSGKAVSVFMDMITREKMYGGVQGFGPAQFLEKGYVGPMKTITVMKGFDHLLNVMENGTIQEQVVAEQKLKYWAAKMNSDIHDITKIPIHRSSHLGSFPNVTDVNLINAAHKFFGNVSLTTEELRSFMIDTGQVWTTERAENYYNALGGVENAKKNIRNIYNNYLEEISKDENKSARLASAVFKDKAFDNTFYNELILPDLEAIRTGKLVPMLFEARQKYKGRGKWDIGIEHPDRFSFYAIMNGTEARPARIKVRRNILQKAHLGALDTTSLKIIEMARAHRISGKLGDAIRSFRRLQLKMINIGTMKTLSLEEIDDILDIKKGLSLEALKRYNFGDDEKNELIEKVSDIINENSEEEKLKVAGEIIDDMENDNFAKAVIDPKNRTIMSLESAQQRAMLAQKKGVFALSVNPKLGNTITLDIESLLHQIATKDELPSTDEVLNIFDKLKKKKDSFVAEVDKTNKTVKLKYLLMEAPAHHENVINLVSKENKKGTAFGFSTRSTKLMDDVLLAYMMAEKNMKKEDSKVVGESVDFLKKQYLTYLLRHVYNSETDLHLPQGFAASAQDANSLYLRLKDIMDSEGWGARGFKGKHAEFLDKWTRNVVNDFSLHDVMVHEETFKKFEFDVKESEFLQTKNFYDRISNVFGSEIKNRAWMHRKFTGFITRPPYTPSGTNPFLTARFNVVPKEIASYFGMDINRIAVAAEYWKLVGGDVDGDQMFGVVHAFNTEKELLNLHESVNRSFIDILNTKIKENGKFKTVRDAISEQRKIIGFENSKARVGYFDRETGRISEKTVELGSQDAEDAIKGNFRNLIDMVEKISTRDPSVVTNDIVKKMVDESALMSVSKRAVGIFTNILETRGRQIMQMDSLSKNNTLTLNKFIGTSLTTGLAGMEQLPISMIKHGVDKIKRISLAVAALTNPYNKNPETRLALKDILSDYFETNEERDKAHQLLTEGIIKYHQKFGTKGESKAWISEQTELNKAISILDKLKIGEPYENINFNEAAESFGSRILREYPRAINFTKTTGKFGAIGAAVFLAANFFRPNQMSNSLNPLDGFVDLGSDINGNHNGILSDLELDRRVPLDTVNASFSKEAFIRLNKMNDKKQRSNIINNILKNSYSNSNPLLNEWKTKPNLIYSNYTTSIPSFGSSQLDRKYG
jgi:hypothetical protein